MMVIHNFFVKPEKREMYIIVLLTLLFINAGFGINLWSALTCPTYYLEYLIVGCMLLIVLRYYKEMASNTSFYVRDLVFALFFITSTFVFTLGYTFILNCPFDPIFFLTTKAPMATVGFFAFIYWPRGEPKSNDKLRLPNLNGGVTVVDSQKITLIELSSGFCVIHKSDGAKLRVNQSLSNIHKLLAPQEFYRINRQQIISKAYIAQIDSIKGRGLKVTVENGVTRFVNKNNTKKFWIWYRS